jgi:hypothetical protein
MDSQYIEDIFSHHPPKNDDVVKAHEDVRTWIRAAAQMINSSVPESPEKTLAVRKLQEAMMYANSAIAIYSRS